jgi:2-amino-4-hydroxy-6-hydroxymethyldihydropteridine diphosphokinase
MMHKAFLSLGSNLGDRNHYLHFALQSMVDQGITVCAVSSVYETEAWGYHSENKFLNQVVEINTGLTPERLLSSLKKIESDAGRKPSIDGNYADRAIDIDIILFDNEVINSDRITIPHPRLHVRKFVLIPLNEIAPNVSHPIFKETIGNLLLKCNDHSDVKIYLPLNKSY